LEAIRERATLVPVELCALDGGGTELTRTPGGLPDADAVARHRSGWADILAKLEEHSRAAGG
jgi:hypothetical protein